MHSFFTIVISLKRSASRREESKRILDNSGLQWEYLDAVDGLQLQSTPPEYHEAKVKRLLGFSLSASEIGCFISHRLAWAKCIEMNCPTLILEDDFSLTPHFHHDLNVVTSSNLDWDIIRLQGLRETVDSTVIKTNGISIVQNQDDPLGATAYIIKPSSAIRLIQCSQDIYEPLDHFIEHFKKHRLRILAIKPYPVVTRSSPTTIYDRPERKPLQGLKKVLRSIARVIDRITSDNPWFPK